MGGISVKKWELYLAKVPFEDMPVSKYRPVVILENKGTTVLCLKMTSKPPREGEYILQEWASAGLLKATTVRISKVLSLPKENFVKRIGFLALKDIIEIQKLITK